MSPSFRDQLWIVAIASCIFFVRLGATTFWDEDETLYAEIVREMIDRQDWTVPLYNGRLVTDKPPMVYWLMISGIRVFGESEFAARVGFAALAVATSLLTYQIGAKIYNRRAGIWAAVAVASNVIFDVSARACTPDSPLVFFTVAALWLYVRAGGLEGGKLAWSTAAAMYGCMGLGMVTKGPVAFVLPVGLLMLYHLGRAPSAIWWKRFSPQAVWHVGWSLRPITAIVVIGAVASPWFAAVGLRTDGQWLSSFFLEHNAKRFLQPNMGHAGPVFYHPLVVMIGFFPWSVFLPQALVHLVRRIRSGDASSKADLFVACWAAAYIVFFSFSKTKLPNYVLPAYPALALVIGSFVDRWLARPSEVHRAWFRWALGSSSAVGGAVVIALGVAGVWLLDGDWGIGLFGLVPFFGGLVAWQLHRQESNRACLAVFGASAVLFVVLGFGIAGPAVNRYHTAPQMMTHWRASTGGSMPLAAYRDLDPSLVYYARRDVALLHEPSDVRAFLADVSNGCLLIRSDKYAAIAAELPDDVRVLERRPRFLKKGEFLLLGRPTTSVASASAPSAVR
ncbi:MAG TPA: glycosyltransferase family 39 protein [Pirellulales bacterium]|nr:glycosyltransferase family 39 protein [Pirellulales bacterium]